MGAEEDGDGGDTFGGGALDARKIISLYDDEVERVQAHDCCFSDIDTRAEYEKSLKQMGLRAKSSARG